MLFRSSHPQLTDATRDWGIEFKGFIIRKILPSNAATVEAFEKQSREEQERKGEEVERDHLIRSVNRMAAEMKMSTKEAAEIFQTERSKISKEVIQINSGGSEVSPIERAAILNTRQKNQP